jgi:serine/threonine protein phosphatase PrpC
MKIFSHSLQGKRESNEDKHVHIINLDGCNKNYNAINFFAVFDGHGGKAVSKYLKKVLPPLFVNKFDKDMYSNAAIVSRYIKRVFDRIQKSLNDDHPKLAQYCGSTACIVIHYKDILWVANIGDSRTIKCNKSNIAEQLTQDHKPNNPDERVRIENLGGKIKFDGVDWRINDLSLSRAFGDIDCTPYVTHVPQIYKYKVLPTDKFIILACDGLWDVISNQDAIDFIISLMICKTKCNYAKELAEHAYKKGSLDNITVIVNVL